MRFDIRSAPPLARTLAAILVLGLPAVSCVATDSTGTGDTAALALVPTFQVVPGDFDAPPTDQIRATVFDAVSLDIVGTLDESVDPAAIEWVLSLGVDMDGAATREVLVEVELLSDGVVQWSGRVGPIVARSGGSPSGEEVVLVRGPLDNLDVTSLTIESAPGPLLVGATGAAVAVFEIAPGSLASPEVYWFSRDGGVADVTSVGTTTTVTGVSAGTTTIVAASGTAVDSVEVEVVPLVQEVIVTPSTATVQLIDQQVPFSAEVIDGFGDPDPSATVTWSSRNETVALVDADGVATTVGFGTTEIEATSGGVTGTATLIVNGPDLVPSNFVVTPDGQQSVVVDLNQVDFQLDITNEGASASLGSFVGFRTIDVAGDTIVQPTFSFLVPPLEPGETFSFQGTPEGQVQPGALPAQVRFEAEVDLADQIAETDETNNSLVSGDFDVSAALGIATWVGTIDSDWDTGGNWSGGQPPQAGDDIVITLGSNQPFLSTSFGIGMLTLEDNTTLTIADDQQLDVLGDISIGTGATLAAETPGGSSTVQLGAPTALVNGVIEPTVLVTGSVTVTGGLVTSGPIIVDGLGAILDVNDEIVQVGGDFSTTNGGVLVMNGALGAQLIVSGDILFEGGDTEGLLTAGTIRANGDFTVAGTTPTAFASTEVHGVVFSGGAARSVSMANPSPDGNRFSIAWFDVPNTVTLLSNVVVTSDMRVFQGTVDSQGELSVAGSLQDATGGLSVLTLRFFDDVTIVPSTVPGPLFVDGDVTWPESATVADDVVIDGTLDVGDFGLTVQGDVFVNGALTVPTLGTVDATGTLELANGSILDVDGAVTAVGGCIDNGASILGAGTTPCVPSPYDFTWVGGASPDPTDFDDPSNWTPVGVPGAGDAVLIPATGTDPVASGALVELDHLIIEDGALLDLNGGQLEVVGDYDGGSGGTLNGEVFIVGGGPALLQGTAEEMTVAQSRTLSGSLDIANTMRVDNAALTIADQGLFISGDLDVFGASARIIMQDPAGDVQVYGTASFDGGSSNTFLTAGRLLLGGDLSVGSTFSSISFLATGAHETVFDGPTLQNVTFSNPGTTTQRFHDLTILNTAGVVVFGSDVVATGTVTVDPGATVDASDDALSVGTAVSLSSATTLQDLIVIGDLTAISTPMNANVRVDADFTLPTLLTINGTLTLNGRSMTVGTNALTVSSDFSVTGSSGRLIMQDAAGSLSIGGNATFNGGSSNTFLTAGQLSLAGDLTVGSSFSSFSFLGTGTHETVFDGAALQTITFSNPGPTTQRFADLVILNTASGVVFGSDVVATGTVTVDPAATVDASDDALSVGAAVSLSSATTLQELIVIGDLTAISTPMNANVRVDADFTLPALLTINGTLTLNGRSLTVGTNALTVTGDFSVTGPAGRLIMRDAAGTVSVAGNAAFNGGSSNTFLSAGQLSLAGDLTVNSGFSTLSFLGDGTHETVFDGAALQTVTFSAPGSTTQRFHDLTILNTGSGVVFGSDVVATGTVTVDPAATVDASDDALSVGTAVSLSSLTTLQDLIVIGDLTAISTPMNADVRVDFPFTLPSTLTINGTLTLNGQSLSVGSNALVVSGDFSVTGPSGRLIMQDGAGTMSIAGDATFDGGSSNTFLSAGQLSLAGDLTVSSAFSSVSFYGTGTHETVFNGTGPQAISFSNPAMNGQRFEDVSFENSTETITILSDLAAAGTLDVSAGAFVDAADDAFLVAGAFLDNSDGISLRELVVTGNLTAHSFAISGDLTVAAAWTLSNNFFVGGDVTVNSALTIGANTLSVSADLTVFGASARLVMQGPGSVNVTGDALFDGGSSNTFLTAGTLRVDGNFTAAQSFSTLSFLASGSHTVILRDVIPGDPTVSFSNPSPTGQRFNNLTLEFPVDVTLASDVVVMGTFDVDDVQTTIRRPALSTSILDVRGTMNVFEMTAVGVPIRLETSVPGSSHSLDNVEFVNGSYGPEDVQLYLELPGGVNFPLLMSGMQFDTAPTFTTGAHLQTVRASGVENFVAELSFPSPLAVNATILQGANTTVIWP